jgi:long-chain acyl-CoA synthetase
MSYSLPLAQFSSMVKQRPNENYLHQPIDRKLKLFTWAEVDHQARTVAQKLLDMGLSKGDRIGLISKNCAEWIITDLAIMMAGMISVPVYHTANRETIQYIINNSACKVVFIGKLDAVEEVEAGVTENIPRIIFPYPSLEGHYHWQDIIAGKSLKDINEPAPHDTMTIVYTSGSTGQPKGVALTFENVAAAATETNNIVKFKAADSLLSYLPLAHITERTVIQTPSYYVGAKIYFVERLDTFVDDLKVAQPDLFVSVPRLWNKFQSEVLNNMPDKKLQLLLKIPILKHIVAKKIRTALGLNNARFYGCGTAPIAPAILQWYRRIGINICEGWGMTETSGLSCCNLPFDEHAIGTIGKPIPCIEIKISSDQEILVRGPAVFSEYYLNPQATEDSFTDGWFHTGDMGAVTNEGNFKIIGRIKEQFKTAKGKFVVPVPIESMLGQNTDIEQICVIGSGRKQPIALVVMNLQNRQQNPSLDSALLSTLLDVNAQLEKHQQLDHIIVLKEEWSVDNNMLTPTMKLKRTEIESTYMHYLDYEFDQTVFWE